MPTVAGGIRITAQADSRGQRRDRGRSQHRRRGFGERRNQRVDRGLRVAGVGVDRLLQQQSLQRGPREAELVDGRCPQHGTVPELVEEKNWFFRLSAFQQTLLDLYDKNPEFVLPRIRHLVPYRIPLGDISRPERSRPAEGYPAAHAVEQARIVREALTGR